MSAANNGQSILKAYIQLTKPGIVRANVMTAAAGFLFASSASPDWLKLIAVCIGNALVIACGCVLNNIMDMHIDARMNRTQKRPLITGLISVKSARIYAVIMGIVGLAILVIFTNLLTAFTGFVAVILYVFVYGWAKRHTTVATEVGTVPGAASIVAGYTAVTNQLDITAFCLFLVMASWQMAHFLAIALYRADEYAAAKITVMPHRIGAIRTQKRAMWYIVLFIVSVLLLAIYSSANFLLFTIVILAGMYWLFTALKAYGQIKPAKWGGKMFGYSLIVLLIFCAVISLVNTVA